MLLPQRIATQCTRRPDATAVLHLAGAGRAGDTTLSYGELHRQAAAIALAVALRIDPEAAHGTSTAVVAVLLDEAPGSVIAELGVMYAGAAFVPLDPGTPAARLHYQLVNCEACVLVHSRTHTGVVQRLLEHDDTCCTHAVELEATIDAAGHHLSAAGASPQPRTLSVAKTLQATDVCHIIYTSGSTGKPKGVVCEHGALSQYADAKLQSHGIGEHAHVLLVSAATWDPSIGDAFSTFACGATLVTAPRARLVQDLAAVLREGAVSHICTTPALWGILPASDSWESFPSLRVVALGGERVPSALIKRWLPPNQECASEQRRRLLNTYGVTEATVYQTVGECRSGDRNGMVGRPLPGVVCAVAAPPGEPGEIYLSGSMLARGYLKAADLTAQKFITVPSDGRDAGDGLTCALKWLAPGCWFRTGDLGRWHGVSGAVVSATADTTVRLDTDGPMLELIGRIDSQIKLRGFRIELGEVESVLTDHDLVGEAAVVLHTGVGAIRACANGIADADEPEPEPEPRLVAFVTLCEGVAPDAWANGGAEVAVQIHCRRQLPAHAVPTQFVRLDRLPLTASGKVNRQVLPDPPPLLQARLGTAPVNQANPSSRMEKAVIEAWSHALGIAVENLSVLDDFFALGGTSVSARDMVQRLPPMNTLHTAAAGSISDSGQKSEAETDWSDGAPNAVRYCALFRKPRLDTFAAALEWIDCSVSAARGVDPEQLLREMDVALPTLNDETSWLNAGLKLAARSGYEVVVCSLLDAQADPNGGHTKKNRGDAPLLLAAQKGHQSTVKVLVHAGANPNLPDASSRTAVHMAAARGHATVLRWLLEEGGGAWTARDVNKWSPHHFAAWHGHTAVLAVLLRYQASQLLCMACECKTRAEARLTELQLQAMAPSWRTPVTAAAGSEVDSTAESIEEVTAAVLRAETLLGSTERWAAGPIATGAVYKKNRTRRDWSFALNARDRWQRTPLCWAIAHNHEAAVRLLLSAGASLDWTSPWPAKKNRRSQMQPWTTSLHLAVAAAAEPGRSNSDGLVLEQRIGSSGTCGKTWQRHSRLAHAMECTGLSDDPLTLEKSKARPEDDRFVVLRTLLELPQLTTNCLNAVDSEGRTALHEAASLPSATAVRLLLAARAEVTVVDHSGQTAQTVAIRTGQTQAAALLLQTAVAQHHSVAAAAASS